MHDFIEAAKNGDLATIQIFINQNIDVDITDESGSPALMWAAGNDHLEVVKWLIDNGADIHKADSVGWTALIWAARNGLLEIVKELILNKAGINPADDKGRTTLMLAAFYGHLEVVKWLIENGADIHKADNNGMTALIWTAWNGHLESVKEFIKNKAEINHADDEGRTSLIWAACNGHLESVKELIKNKAEINHADNYGMTALIWAAWNGHLESVKELMKNKAEINHADNKGLTALMLAANKGHLEVVKWLIDNGAEILKADNNGMTALMYAVGNGDLEVAKELLNAGSDLLLNPKGEGFQNIILYKLLNNEASYNNFDLLLAKGFEGLNAVAKLELLRTFNFMQNNYDKFASFYPQEKIQSIKASLAAERPLEELIDISSFDSNNRADIHTLNDKLKQLKHILKHKASYEVEGININEVAIYNTYIDIKNLANREYQRFTHEIKHTIKAFMPKAEQESEVGDKTVKSESGLLDLQNEILAKIFFEALIANKLEKDNLKNEAESENILCATDKLYKIYDLMGNIES
jgi:ankyrin repeat protein